MRILLLTANPKLEATDWWRVVLAAPGLEAVLLVRQVYSLELRDVLRRLRRNIRKHGWLFIVYRLALLIRERVEEAIAPPSGPRLMRAPTVQLEVITTTDMHAGDVVERVRAWKPDLGVSIGAPVLRANLFELPSQGTLNVHLGRVPDYRGAPPGFWELWFGATEIGATIHWIDAGIDTGAVVEEATAPVYPGDTPARLEARAAELGRRLLARALRRAADGRAQGRVQPAAGRTNRFPTIRQVLRLWRRLWWRRVRRRIESPWYPVKAIAASTWLWLCCPLLELVRAARGRQPIRIFTFHRVSDLCRDGMTVSPSIFRQQIDYITRHHQVVPLHEAVAQLQGGAPLRQPLAVITFDDGYRSVTRSAKPIMDELGVPGTCFVCTGVVGNGHRYAHDAESPVRDWLDVMDWPDLEGLLRDGWEIGAHTVSHARLASLSGPLLAEEIHTPLPVLRERLRVDRLTMAIPFGGRNDITEEGIALARRSGYSAMFWDFGGENHAGDEPFALRRIDLGGDHETLMWKAMTRGLDLGGWGQRLRHRGAS